MSCFLNCLFNGRFLFGGRKNISPALRFQKRQRTLPPAARLMVEGSQELMPLDFRKLAIDKPVEKHGVQSFPRLFGFVCRVRAAHHVTSITLRIANCSLKFARAR